MRHHAELTQRILGRIDAFAELAEVCAAHHERLDGKGYPYGLTADQISLETRIITTADIYDAITADRPYRAALSPQRTLEIMEEERGRALDPRCLRALRDCVARVPGFTRS
jgi:HD-GYP domain-containing protein (c-di-GMP phosphodiesterase class II)